MRALLAGEKSPSRRRACVDGVVAAGGDPSPLDVSYRPIWSRCIGSALWPCRQHAGRGSGCASRTVALVVTFAGATPRASGVAGPVSHLHRRGHRRRLARVRWPAACPRRVRRRQHDRARDSGVARSGGAAARVYVDRREAGIRLKFQLGVARGRAGARRERGTRRGKCNRNEQYARLHRAWGAAHRNAAWRSGF